jgi:hypothetical protein
MNLKDVSLKPNNFLACCENTFLPPAARGVLFEKTTPLDPPQKLLFIFIRLRKKRRGQAKIIFRGPDNFYLLNEKYRVFFIYKMKNI